VGLSDGAHAGYHTARLTTIRQLLRDMGSSAARIVLPRHQGFKDYPPELLILPNSSFVKPPRPQIPGIVTAPAHEQGAQRYCFAGVMTMLR
jgi:hypothetical protein